MFVCLFVYFFLLKETTRSEVRLAFVMYERTNALDDKAKVWFLDVVYDFRLSGLIANGLRRTTLDKGASARGKTCVFSSW